MINKDDQSKTDSELINQYKQNENQDALSLLYNRYITLIYGLCLKYLKDESHGKDAVMDIYELVSKKLKTHDVSNFKSWLYVLSKNHCLGVLRKNQTTLTKQKQAEVMYSDQIYHPDNIDREDHIQKLEKCMEQLQEEQSTCIKMFYFEKQSYQEIVSYLELEWNQVRSHIQNGRRNLKNCLEDNRG